MTPERPKSKLKAAAGKMLSGNMAVVGLQALNFLLLARTLGSAQFGALATINAAAAILTPVAGLGFGSVMLMKVSRDAKAAPQAAGNALAMQGLTGLLIAFIGAVALMHLSSFHVPLALCLAVLIAELVLMRTSITAAQFFSALEKYGVASMVNVAASCARVLSIGSLVLLLAKPTIEAWAAMFVCVAAVFATGLVVLMHRFAGGLSIDRGAFRSDFSSGLDFSFGTLAKAIYTDVDKLVLARFATASDVGIYASAYRLAVMAFSPVRALLDASAARFFREGASGLKSAVKVSLGLMRVTVPYTVLVALVLGFGAPLLPLIFGADYAPATPILRIIAFLPLVQGVHYTLSDALSGAGMQRARALCQSVVVLVYVALAFLIIPKLGPLGAAITCMSSEMLLAVLIGAVVAFRVRRN